MTEPCTACGLEANRYDDGLVYCKHCHTSLLDGIVYCYPGLVIENKKLETKLERVGRLHMSIVDRLLDLRNKEFESGY